MKYRTASEQPLGAPEVVLNLWAYASADDYIMRLAGKTYVMQGEDEDKLALLRLLSATDFPSAPWCKVPANFKLINSDGSEMVGVAATSSLSDPYSHGHLFGSLIEDLAQALPEQLQSISGEYSQFRLELPENPLTITTLVVEHEDGRLVPMISGE